MAPFIHFLVLQKQLFLHLLLPDCLIVVKLLELSLQTLDIIVVLPLALLLGTARVARLRTQLTAISEWHHLPQLLAVAGQSFEWQVLLERSTLVH